MKNYLILSAFFFISLSAFCQSEFQVKFSNHLNTQAKDLIHISGKKTILFSDITPNPGYGISLLCLDSNYLVLWNKEIIPPNLSLYSKKILESTNGDLIMAASAVDSVGRIKTMILRWNSNGQLLWNKYYEGLGFMNEPTDIIELPSGNIIVICKENYSSVVFNSFLLKLDRNGAVISKTTYSNATRLTALNNILYNNNSKLIVSGTVSDGQFDSYYFSSELDTNGVLLSQNSIYEGIFSNTGNGGFLDAIRNTGSSRITMIGLNNNFNNPNTNSLFTCDSAGVTQTILNFLTDSIVLRLPRLNATSDSGIVVTGLIPVPNSICLIKFDKNNVPQFARKYAIDHQFFLQANIGALETEDHGFLLAVDDNIVIKTDSTGSTSCGNDTLMNVSIQSYIPLADTLQMSFTSGVISGSGYALIVNDVAINADSICQPLKVETNEKISFEISPIPASSIFKVKTLESKFDKAELRNVTGQNIKLFSSTFQVNEAELNVEELPSGIYLIILSNKGVNLYSKKVMISR